MVMAEAKTNKNKCRSSNIDKGSLSGASIKTADKYWAKIIMGMLYPLTTENKLAIFFNKSLCLRFNIFIEKAP